jgi:hypothetical protein
VLVATVTESHPVRVSVTWVCDGSFSAYAVRREIVIIVFGLYRWYDANKIFGYATGPRGIFSIGKYTNSRWRCQYGDDSRELGFIPSVSTQIANTNYATDNLFRFAVRIYIRSRSRNGVCRHAQTPADHSK